MNRVTQYQLNAAEQNTVASEACIALGYASLSSRHSCEELCCAQ